MDSFPSISPEGSYVSSMIRARRNALVFGYIVFFAIATYYGLGGSDHPDAGKLITAALAGGVAGIICCLIANDILLRAYGVPAEYRGSYAFWRKSEPQRAITISIPSRFESDGADVLASSFFPTSLNLKAATVHRGGVVRSPDDPMDVSSRWGVLLLTRAGLAFFPNTKDDDVEFLKGLGWTALQTMRLGARFLRAR
jgi:hypothetical protein